MGKIYENEKDNISFPPEKKTVSRKRNEYTFAEFWQKKRLYKAYFSLVN